mgnify:FL=1
MDFSAKDGRVNISLYPPLDGITIERVDLETQCGMVLFSHENPGQFISSATFMDTNSSAIFRIRWRDGALAVWIPPANVPVELSTFFHANPSNAPVRPLAYPPLMANATGEHLFLPPGQPLPPQISISQFKRLRILELSNRQISDISFLAGMDLLEHAILNHNRIGNLAPLAALSNLFLVDFSDNRISDLTPLANLTKLKYLYITQNQLKDLAPLAECRQLEALAINGNIIQDLSGIRNAVGLQMLFMDSNPISDLEPLRGLTNVFHLMAQSCRLTDIEPLSGMRSLDFIFLNNNAIENLSPLASLDCSFLSIQSNQVHDISPLLEIASRGGFLERRGNMHGIDLRGNPLSRESIDLFIPELRNRYGIEINY